ncbi:hypothetical protein UMZ34_10430 [Halopseudomonas pachastrellae]|nr:hypothetical protein UMZ34_10430 [Halopseudomonas pachastrellae]
MRRFWPTQLPRGLAAAYPRADAGRPALCPPTPGSQASDALWSTLYAGHPYGIPPDGTEESINAITREDLQGFQQTYYSAPAMP